MTWFERNATRAAAEIRVVRAATNARFMKQNGMLLFDEDVDLGGILFGLRVTYPTSFPDTAPIATIRCPELPFLAEVHRFRNGVLCLHGDDEWHPNHTGLWIRNRAIAWMHGVVVYSATGAWPEMRT